MFSVRVSDGATTVDLDNVTGFTVSRTDPMGEHRIPGRAGGLVQEQAGSFVETVKVYSALKGSSAKTLFDLLDSLRTSGKTVSISIFEAGSPWTSFAQMKIEDVEDEAEEGHSNVVGGARILLATTFRRAGVDDLGNEAGGSSQLYPQLAKHDDLSTLYAMVSPA